MPTPREINPLYRAVLLAAGLIVLGLLFRQLLTLVVAILITVIIAIPLALAADKLERRGIPRFFGALFALVLGLGIFAGVIALVIPPFVDQTQEFVDSVPATLEDLEGEVGRRVRHLPRGGGPERPGVPPALHGRSRQPDRPARPDRPERRRNSRRAHLHAPDGVLHRAQSAAARAAACSRSSRRRGAKPANHLTLRLRTAWVGWLEGVVIDMLVTGVLLYLGSDADRPRVRDLLRRLLGPPRRDPLLRSGDRRRAGLPVRARGLADDRPSRPCRLHRRPADRGERDHPARHGATGEAPPRPDRDRRRPGRASSSASSGCSSRCRSSRRS